MSENTMKRTTEVYDRSSLKADCANCFGLCCTALYFSKTEGFPVNKQPGKPCPKLLEDYKCCVHDSLVTLGYKGCIGFDCFGAGHRTAQSAYGGKGWRANPDTANQMFEVFLVLRQLCEMQWYLTEAVGCSQTLELHQKLWNMIQQTEAFLRLSPEEIVLLDVAKHRAPVNELLLHSSKLMRSDNKSIELVHSQSKKTEYSEKPRSGKQGKKLPGPGANLTCAKLTNMDLSNQNLRGACMIAADLRGANLAFTDLIGADLRDANLCAADLSQSIFLTQAQINSAKGNMETRIPEILDRPVHWK